MVGLKEEGVEALSDVDLDLIHGEGGIIQAELVLGHVDVERLEVLLDISDLLMQVVLLMIELNVVVPLDVAHQGLDLALIVVHSPAKLVLLT